MSINDTNKKILIVEDEIIIAESIKRYLNSNDIYHVVGIAISYEEAVQLYIETHPDIVLVDVRLYGEKSGIDLARYIQSTKSPCPHIYLTSQLDKITIDSAKTTFPSGYITKPIRKEELHANIEIALFTNNSKKAENIEINDGSNNYIINIDKVLYIKSSHIYIHIVPQDDSTIIVRKSLKEIMQKLPNKKWIHPHRSYLVNLDHITMWDNHVIKINNHEIPISRNQRNNTLALIKNHLNSSI